MEKAISCRKNLARSASYLCWAASADAALRKTLCARAGMGARSPGRVLPVRPELRGSVHLPDHARSDAGADDARQAAPGVLLREHQPAVFIARLAGGLRAGALGVPRAHTLAAIAASVRFDRARRGKPAHGNEPALAANAAGADARGAAAGGADE